MNPVFDRLRKLVNEKIAGLTDDLSSGRVSADDYRNVTGQIRGLRFALEFVAASEKASVDGEEGDGW